MDFFLKMLSKFITAVLVSLFIFYINDFNQLSNELLEKSKLNFNYIINTSLFVVIILFILIKTKNDNKMIKYCIQIPLETLINTAYITFSSLCGIVLYLYINTSNVSSSSLITMIIILVTFGFIVISLVYSVENRCTQKK